MPPELPPEIVPELVMVPAWFLKTTPLCVPEINPDAAFEMLPPLVMKSP